MKRILASLLIGTAVLAAPAAAQEAKGSVQVKVLGTAVLPDGKITDVKTDNFGLPANTQTEANDNYVPTLAIEYFLNDNFSVETICCMTQHDVDGVTGLPGAELVSNAKLIPATVTGKAHVDLGAIKPYVGAGVTYFWWVDVDPGAAVASAITKTDLSDEFGFVLQGGVDVPINDKGLGLTLDAKKYFVGTTASWYDGSTLVIETEHDLDPWVLSAGVSYRF
tara:strand:+ start:799 stop:1464 length:666 start_codon:yes stop_codon:yes gene_type:complete